jgi:zinc protease
LSFTILVSFLPVVGSYASFKDVSDTHLNAAAIHYLQEQGVLTGYADGTFKPDDRINRAEFVKIIVHSILKKVPEQDSQQCFPDVAIDQWFSPYVCYAKSIGVISGYSDGTFQPVQNITFVEAAKIIVNAFEFSVGEDEVWYRPHVETLSSRKAIPMTINRFDYVISRGEMSEMIYRLLAEVMDKTSRTFQDLDPSGGSVVSALTGSSAKYNDDKDVVERQLPNGFTYFHRYNNRPAGAVHLELVVKVGSAYEEPGNYGIAHFLEHMVFNGTESFSEGDIFKYMASIGAPVGADTNAFTSPDSTVYQLRVPNSIQDFEQGIKILSEFAGKAVFDPAEINRERPVVFEEMRRGHGKDQRFLDKYLPTVFRKSGYGHNVIGLEKDLYALDRDDFLQFYKKWYRPDNMALVVVGDISEEDVHQMVQQYFSEYQAPTTPLITNQLREPDQSETAYLRFSDPETQIGTFGISFRIDSPLIANRQQQKDFLALQYALLAINNRFDDFYSSQDQEQVYMNTSLTPELNSKYGSVDFTVYYVPDESARVIPAFLQEIERIKNYGISDQELKRVQDSITDLLEFANLETESLENTDYLRVISDAYWKGDRILSVAGRGVQLREMNRELDAEYVSGVIKSTFENKNRLVTLELPDIYLEKVSTFQVQQWMENMSRNALERYDSNLSQGNEVEVTGSGTVVDQSSLGRELGMTRTVFENGLVLRTKKTTSESNAVYVRMSIRGGHLFLPAGQQYLDDFLVEALSDGGTVNKTLREFQNYTREHQLSLSLSSGLVKYEFSGYSPVSSFENLLSASREFLFEPAFEDSGLKKSRDELLHRRLLSLWDPEGFFETRYNQMLFQDATHTVIPSADQINTYSKEQLIKLHREYFVPSNIEMNVVGNIDEKEMIRLVSQYFGTLPKADAPPFKETLRTFRFPNGSPVEELKIGSEDKASTLMVFKGVHDLHQDYVKWDILSSVLTERLSDRIRENLGGTYTISSYLNPMYFMEGGTLEVSFDSDPLKTYDLFRETITIMNDLKVNGITEDELQRALQPMKVSFASNLQKNNFWFYLGDEMNGVPFNLFHDRNRELATLTVDDINTVAKSLDLQNYFRMVLLPRN